MWWGRSPQKKKKNGNNDKGSVKVSHTCLNKGSVTVTDSSDKRYFTKNIDSNSDDGKISSDSDGVDEKKFSVTVTVTIKNFSSDSDSDEILNSHSDRNCAQLRKTAGPC